MGHLNDRPNRAPVDAWMGSPVELFAATRRDARESVGQLEADDPADDHHEEDDLERRERLFAGCHRVGDGQHCADANPHCVGRTDRQTTHRISQTRHTCGEGRKKDAGRRQLRESLGLTQSRRPDRFQDPRNDKYKPVTMASRGPSCRSPGTAPIVWEPVSGSES